MPESVADALDEVAREGSPGLGARADGGDGNREDDADADDGGDDVDPEGRDEAAPPVDRAGDDRREEGHRGCDRLIDPVDAHELGGRHQLGEEGAHRGLLEPLADGADRDGREDEPERGLAERHPRGESQGDEGDHGVRCDDDRLAVHPVRERAPEEGHDRLGDEGDDGVQHDDPPLLEGEGEVPEDRVLDDARSEEGDRLGAEEEADAALPVGEFILGGTRVGSGLGGFRGRIGHSGNPSNRFPV